MQVLIKIHVKLSELEISGLLMLAFVSLPFPRLCLHFAAVCTLSTRTNDSKKYFFEIYQLFSVRSCTALEQVATQQQQQQPLVIDYPSSSVSYIDFWPDGVELSLLCATSPQWSMLSFQWYKDGVALVNSDTLRHVS